MAKPPKNEAAPPKAPKPEKPKAPTPPPVLSSLRAAAAYNSVLPRLIALDSSVLRPLAELGVDVHKVVQTAITAAPKVRALRFRIVEELPKLDAQCVDDLETLALAVWFALVRDETVGSPDSSIEQLMARARPLREDLLVAAEPLARKGLMDSEKVRIVREGNGADLANELAILSELFTWAWADVHNKTAVTHDEVAAAGALAQQLFVAGGRAGEKEAPEGVTDFSARAWHLFARCFDDCARAVAYLRWSEGDAGEILAPIVVKKAKAKAAAKENSTTETAPQQTPPGAVTEAQENTPAVAEEAKNNPAEHA